VEATSTFSYGAVAHHTRPAIDQEKVLFERITCQ
jgi:hypothetical protein